VAKDEVFTTIEVAVSQLEEVRAIPEELRTKIENGLVRIDNYRKQNIPLIDLRLAISAGGIFEDSGLPRLGVAHYIESMEEGSTVVTVYDNGAVRYESVKTKKWVSLPSNTLSIKSGLLWDMLYPLSGCTTIPIVHPTLRQKDSEDVYLLFESKWEKIRVVVDPYLLKHVAGYIFAVLGSWDVTVAELEAYNTARNLGL
jgi:hypothetical protein